MRKYFDFLTRRITVCLLIMFVLVVWGVYLLIQNNSPEVHSEVIDIATLSVPHDMKEQRNFWTDIIAQYGGLQAYQAFSRINDETKLESHTFAHVFGEALYQVEGMKGIRVCDTHFRFGCYHSFFGIAIYHEGISVLPKLDALCREAYGEVDTRCQHGLGHGLLVFTGYENLREAIELCATLPSWQPIGGCAGGVFMEYNFHTMEESSGVTFVRDSLDNLYEPCTSLPLEFQPSCYHEQVQWWLSIFENDFEYVGSLCTPLSGDDLSWSSCYRRVGNFITEYDDVDFDAVIEVCKKMENDTADELCREGAASPLAGIEKYRDIYLQLCSTLTEHGAQERCEDFVDGWGF